MFTLINISGMDEVYYMFKFGKSIDYGKSHPRGKQMPSKGAWSGSHDHFGMKPHS